MQGDFRWCWLGLSAWGRIELQGYSGRLAWGRATREGGTHAGEVEEDDRTSGLTVCTGPHALGQTGKILVSNPLKALVAGSGIIFDRVDDEREAALPEGRREATGRTAPGPGRMVVCRAVSRTEGRELRPRCARTTRRRSPRRQRLHRRVEFVGEVPWTHLDICGPMKVDTEREGGLL